MDLDEYDRFFGSAMMDVKNDINCEGTGAFLDPEPANNFGDDTELPFTTDGVIPEFSVQIRNKKRAEPDEIVQLNETNVQHTTNDPNDCELGEIRDMIFPMPQHQKDNLMQSFGMPKSKGTWYLDHLGYVYIRDHHGPTVQQTTYRCQWYTMGSKGIHYPGSCKVKAITDRNGLIVGHAGTHHTHPNPTTKTSEAAVWRKIMAKATKGSTARCAKKVSTTEKLNNSNANADEKKLHCMNLDEMQKFYKAIGHRGLLNIRSSRLYEDDKGFTYHKRKTTYVCSFYELRKCGGMCNARLYTDNGSVITGPMGSDTHSHPNPRHDTDQFYAWRESQIRNNKKTNGSKTGEGTDANPTEMDMSSGSTSEDVANTVTDASAEHVTNDVIVQETYPLLYTCSHCQAVVVVANNSAYGSLMQAGSAHIIQYHKNEISKHAAVANQKMIYKFFPHMRTIVSNSKGTESASGIAPDWKEYQCKSCGLDKLVNMPDETLDDNVLVNHAYTHLKQGEVLTTSKFWELYPQLGPKKQKKPKIEMMNID